MVLPAVAWVGFKEGRLSGKYPCVVHLNESRLRSRHQLSRQGPDRIFEGFLSSICLNFCTSGNHGMFATSFVLLYSVLSWEYPILRFNCTYLYFMQETGEMSVVVADFGLARVLRDRPASPKNHVTSTNWSSSNTSRPLLIPGHKPPPPKKR